MLIHYYLIIIGRRRGAAAGGAERGGATICTDQVSGHCPRVDAAFEAGQWSRRPRLKGLPSTRRCSGRGRGGDLLFLAEREQAPPCPVCEAGRWSCHLRFTTTTPQSSPARDTFPLAGLSWSRVCAAEAGPLGDSADGTRLGRRLPRKHGWHPWRGARLRKVGHGSPRNSLANTRAPPRLWWARCGRTSTSVIVPRRAA